MLLEETNVMLYTLHHVSLVRSCLNLLANKLEQRALDHGLSKFTIDEFEGFFQINKIAREFSYGSKEYQQSLVDGKTTFDLHYARNSHHPEYYPNGIQDMSLLDFIEMVIDWRVANKAINKISWTESLEKQKERFGLDDNHLWLIDLIIRELE